MEKVDVTNTEEKVFDVSKMTCNELVDQLATILENDSLPNRKDVDMIKSQFYKNKYLLGDNVNLEEIEIQETRLGDLLNLFKERDRKRMIALEEEMENNKIKKEQLLAQFKLLFESSEDFGKIFAIFRDIKETWSNIGSVDPKFENSLQSEYNTLTENFYDLKHLNDEYRDMDFKKNLEIKLNLLNEMEPLCSSSDVVDSLKKLQILQREWNTTGPVPKENREDLKVRFKELSTTIYKNHQDFFDNKKKEERLNAESKKDICSKILEVASRHLSTAKEWETATKDILNLQQQWKNVGLVAKKDGDILFANYRSACDKFFNQKSEFFTNLKIQLDEVYKQKQKIIDEAKSLEGSNDWKSTSDRLKELQKIWKGIKHITSTKKNEDLWKEFRTCCDNFFNRLKESNASDNNIQLENLKKKEDIISKLQQLKDSVSKDVASEFIHLKKQWYEIGHVPFQHKDKINKSFAQFVKHFEKQLKETISQRRLEGYQSSVSSLKGENEIHSELSRIRRIAEKMKQEAKVFETNMSMLNVSDNKSPIVKELIKKKEKLEEDIRLMDEKIKILLQKLD